MAKHKKVRWNALVAVCVGSDCRKAGSKKVYRAARQAIADADAKKTCLLRGVDCMKLCAQGPVASVQPSNEWFTKATPDEIAQAITRVCKQRAN